MDNTIYDAENENISNNDSGNENNNANVDTQKNTVTIIPENSKHKIHFLTIIGQIEGHTVLPPQTKTTKYEYVIPQMINVAENSDIEGLMIILNTVGGDVEAGLAIAEMIANIPKPTVSLVLGGGHSIGVPLAVSADVSFIAPSATMTIHPIRMNGTMIGVSQTYEYFNKVQEQIVSFIEAHSNITGDAFRDLMLTAGNMANDVGTILFGDEAVNTGLIDRVGGISNAIEELNNMIENK